ncbi:MAG: CtkA family protein [Lachnospiraceae bacterium]|nr:CtkA family protein [Lachnospiraceae bacterium]
MIDIVNLGDCPLSRKNGTYGGAAGNKEGILFKGELWLVKYPKNIRGLQNTGGASYSTAPLSEYIGSRIFDILGYDVHRTFLGERNDKLVVACKDFAIQDILLEIRTIKNYANKELAELLEESFSETESSHLVNLEEVLLHMKYNPILRNVEGICERFWEQAIVDIYINNNDRNNGNWGILRDIEGADFLAPVFDNGGCLQTKISENKICAVLANEAEAAQNACNTQTAYGIGGHALSAKKFLDLYETHIELRKALLKAVPLIKDREQKIHDMICDIPEKHMLQNGGIIDVCSYNRKKLYLLQMRSRLENLLEPYWKRAQNFKG